MSENKAITTKRVSRRSALRAGAGASVVGAGAAMTATAARAQDAGGRTMHLEVDVLVGMPVSIVRAGSGPPQRGDWFFVDAVLYEVGKTDGPPIGDYQCFGAWTAAATDTSAPNQRFTSVQFSIAGRGAIMGLINEAGAAPATLVGAVQGGTGEFSGALGTFKQVPQTSAVVGVTPSQPAGLPVRAMFDLLLPSLGQEASNGQ
jgi:hypothetical protein